MKFKKYCVSALAAGTAMLTLGVNAAHAGAEAHVVAQEILGGNNFVLQRGDQVDPTSAAAAKSFTANYQANNSYGGCGQTICNVSGFSDAAAYADLTTGAIGVKALAQGVPGLLNEEFRASALGMLSDTLHFNSTATIPFSVAINGTLWPANGAALRQDGFMQYQLQIFRIGGANGSTAPLQLTGQVSATTPFFVVSNIVGSGASITKFGASGVSGSFNVDPNYDYRINLLLSVRSNADYSHTAAFRFPTLPSGVTFSSASGVFLTGVHGAVPEPSTWATMISGFGLAGGALRRRRPLAA
jgi:PEP-CTERM motif